MTIAEQFLQKYRILFLFALSCESMSNGVKLCTRSRNPCNIKCTNWNLNLIADIVRMRQIINAQEPTLITCTLILEYCIYSNLNKLTENILDESDIKIDSLKIINSQIDLNEIKWPNLKNLKSLTIKNTTTTALCQETLHLMPNLRKFSIKRNNIIKSVEKCLLHDTSINYLQIHGINLNRTETSNFFSNLTCGHDVPSIRTLDWAHNNVGTLKRNWLLNYPNLKSLILTNSNIFNFEEDAFNRGKIIRININQNRIQKLPEKTFGSLMEKAYIRLEDNLLICDCEMEWLQNLAKKNKYIFKNFQDIICASPGKSSFLETDMCPENNTKNERNKHSNVVHPPQSLRCSFKQNWRMFGDYISWSDEETFATTFNVLNKEPDYLEIILSNGVDVENTFMWYVDYSNVTYPIFNCLKIFKQNFSIYVKPDVNYIICLASVSGITDCFPIKTKPLYENQPWLTNKSIGLSITCVMIGLLFALATGALIIYLSVRKNPSLIRGSKRVIEVKRHDKAQLLIMPRGYENINQADNCSMALTGFRQPLEPSTPSLNSDTISTVSYVSANQPTQLEILTYRWNRLREIFQRQNDLPPPLPSLPMQISSPTNNRLPPNVDLLLEYEWYTITTTTTEEKCY